MSTDIQGQRDAQAKRASFLAEMGIKVQWHSRARLASEELEYVEPEFITTDELTQPSVGPSHSPSSAAILPQNEPRREPNREPSKELTPPVRVAPAAPIVQPKPVAAKPSKTDLAWDDDVSLTAANTHSAKQGSVAVPASLEERATAIAQMDWHQLERAVAQCTACSLCRGRTQAVFGVGDKQAKWLLVGEGPGRTEDALGEPFVGKSGKLLDNMLASLQLKRGQNVYIANIVKCRPTDASGNDRPPSEQEAALCRPFLERQIALLQPKLLLALGRTAAVSLLQVDPQTMVGSLRGRVQQINLAQDNNAPRNLPVVVTYHPAYLLRKPVDKAKAWADLCLAQQHYEQ